MNGYGRSQEEKEKNEHSNEKSFEKSRREDGVSLNTEGEEICRKQQKGDGQTQKEQQEKQDERIENYGQITLEHSSKHKIHLLSIIGEIEGHEVLPATSKSTKYEHVLPQLAAVEDDCEIEGLLVLLHTMGGDVESGLAIAEMIASMSKPSVSLVLGGSHSIGVPLAVSTDYSYIVPTGTMILHPVRMSGTVIGAPQTYDYFNLIQDRIVSFVAAHSHTTKVQIEQMMLATGILTKDLGTILVGQDVVDRGLIDAVGGMSDAFQKLQQLIENKSSVSLKKWEI